MIDVGRAGRTAARSPVTRLLRPVAEIDLRLTLAPLRHGASDPCVAFDGHEVWRATRTPEGAATLRLYPTGDGIAVEGWGEGARWAVDTSPDLIGLHDDPTQLRPQDGVLRRLSRALPGLRMTRSLAVIEALVPTIVEQKVQSVAARRSYRALVRSYGHPAPGPRPLLLPPAPEPLASLPYWEFHRFGIERRRAETIRAACSHARRLEETTSMEADAGLRRLRSLPGIGAWTAAEVARKAWGDPDAVRVGDYHLPHLVAWTLAGEPRASDERMLELLEPYRGQRGRAARLIEIGGRRPPRRAPRIALRSIERI